MTIQIFKPKVIKLGRYFINFTYRVITVYSKDKSFTQIYF